MEYISPNYTIKDIIDREEPICKHGISWSCCKCNLVFEEARVNEEGYIVCPGCEGK